MAPSSQKGGQNRKGGPLSRNTHLAVPTTICYVFGTLFGPKRGVKFKKSARGRKVRKTLRKNATQKRPPGRRGDPKPTISLRVFGPFRTGRPKGPNGPKRRPFASVKHDEKRKLAKTTKKRFPKKGPFYLANSRGPAPKRAPKKHTNSTTVTRIRTAFWNALRFPVKTRRFFGALLALSAPPGTKKRRFSSRF